ncbi:serpin family protein, partial [Clostridium perfringens]
GMIQAFDRDAADFSAMADDGEKFWIEKVKHKTVVDVSEKGTEAAAITAVMVETGAVQLTELIVMNVDRPFFFAIEDRDTATWVFMGSVLRP